MQGVLSRILKELETGVLNRKEDIDLANFKRIDAKDYGKSIAFIDGGNAELVKAPNFSLQFIRTCGIVFRNNEKTDIIKNEFFMLATANEERGITFKARIFPLKGGCIDENDLSLNCLDETIKQGKEKASISITGCIARRFAELKLASETDADIIVIDGNLKPVYTNEKKYIERLMKKDSIICGLAKTSDIITSKGNCPVSMLNEADIDYAWHYPTNKRIFAKLNKASSYVFSIEIKGDIETAVNQIACNSNDAVFPGYPYGLILADKLARISNNEKEQILLMIKASGCWNRIKNYTNAVNSHDLLDSIN